MPRRKDGTYYTTDPVEEIKGALSGDEADEKRVKERLLNARKYAGVGGRLGSVVPLGGTIVGSTLGAIGGFILGDQETVFPVDMIAIPAYQAYLIQGTPAFQIFIKEGEVLTQVQPTDAMVSESLVSSGAALSKPKKKRKSKYHAAYSKAFKQLESKYKLKSGKWAKNGFKRCAAAARKEAKK